MKNKLIVLIVLAVIVIFFTKFFMPAPSPADNAQLKSASDESVFSAE